jgi:hypothetical protein
MDFLEHIAAVWCERANDLAPWVMKHLVNRTDVWGRYVRRKGDETTRVVTVPFRDQRGKVFLDVDSLRKHFRTRQPSGQLGLHSASSDLTSRWLAIDIDLHDPDDQLSVTAEANLVAALGWYEHLVGLGLDPVLMDSNGIGGFHLLVVFAEPMSTKSVYQFGKRLLADFERRGLADEPEVFPEKPKWDHYGNWLRLPGRHHSRPHYTRIWNDEPHGDSRWLVGYEAIDRLLDMRTAAPAVLEQLGIARLRRTVCLDFDGVLHSYRSGWCGATVISDPPIHGTREAVARLREQYCVVVYSTRCHTEEGRNAVKNWLQRHDIVVDDICEHKPPALVYVDDRAIRFRGDWNDTMTEIHNFRK